MQVHSAALKRINPRTYCCMIINKSQSQKTMQNTMKPLPKLDDEKHSEEEIRALIQCTPAVLSTKDEDDCLPIQKAAYDYDNYTDSWDTRAIPFIPLLAEEGAKLNVGGKGMRGGLLCENKSGNNVLHHLTWVGGQDSNEESTDLRCLDAMKRLQEMGFLRKEDIKKYGLLRLSLSCAKKHRFNYLADFDSKTLRELIRRRKRSLMLHDSVQIFQMVLTASLRLFPKELGLVFLKDGKGRSSFNIANMKYGKKRAWEIIEQCLDNPECIRTIEKNPETKMLQLMHAAAGDSLDMVYYLLRRDPIV